MALPTVLGDALIQTESEEAWSPVAAWSPPLQNSAAEKRGLWEGVVQKPLRRALFCVFLCSSGLKKTRPFRFLLLKSAVLDWFVVSSCLVWLSFTCQTLAVNARNRAKTTKFKSDVLETPVILMPGFWGDFLLQISQKFLSEMAPPVQAFSGKPPREKPQNAAAEKPWSQTMVCIPSDPWFWNPAMQPLLCVLFYSPVPRRGFSGPWFWGGADHGSGPWFYKGGDHAGTGDHASFNRKLILS